MSAKAPGRPVFQEMLDYIEKNSPCIVYVWKLDRLARNAFDGGKLSWFMDRKLISEIRTYEKVYRNIADDKFFMSLDFGIAKKYVDDLSVNVKRGIKTKMEKGGWPTLAPFGYLNDKANKTVYPNPKIAPYITKMFEMYATGGYALNDLVKMFYEKGLRTKGGNKVYKSLVHRALKSPFYCGFIRREGKLIPGIHEPLVSKDLFDQVQDIVSSKNRSRKIKHNFTYRGYMKCNVCSCALTATLKKGHTYYYCTNGKRNCDQHKNYLRSELVDNIMTDVLSNIAFTEQDVDFMYRAAKEKVGQEKDYTETIAENLVKQLSLARTKQNKLLDSYLLDSSQKKFTTPKCNPSVMKLQQPSNRLKIWHTKSRMANLLWNLQKSVF